MSTVTEGSAAALRGVRADVQGTVVAVSGTTLMLAREGAMAVWLDVRSASLGRRTLVVDVLPAAAVGQPWRASAELLEVAGVPVSISTARSVGAPHVADVPHPGSPAAACTRLRHALTRAPSMAPLESTAAVKRELLKGRGWAAVASACVGEGGGDVAPGDSMLGGVLVAMRWRGASVDAALLAGALGRTGALGAAALEDHAAGFLTRAEAGLLGSLGEDARLGVALGALAGASVGHSWRFAEGLLLGLEAPTGGR